LEHTFNLPDPVHQDGVSTDRQFCWSAHCKPSGRSPPEPGVVLDVVVVAAVVLLVLDVFWVVLLAVVDVEDLVEIVVDVVDVLAVEEVEVDEGVVVDVLVVVEVVVDEGVVVDVLVVVVPVVGQCVGDGYWNPVSGSASLGSSCVGAEG